MAVFCSFSLGMNVAFNVFRRTDRTNRYLSIATIVLSNFGYFGNFTEIACRRYYLISPVFKGSHFSIFNVLGYEYGNCRQCFKPWYPMSFLDSGTSSPGLVAIVHDIV